MSQVSQFDILIRCSIGSFEGINYKQIPRYADRVKLITDGMGADVILDPVFGSFYQNNIDCLAMDGRWVVYGFMGGSKL